MTGSVLRALGCVAVFCGFTAAACSASEPEGTNAGAGAAAASSSTTTVGLVGAGGSGGMNQSGSGGADTCAETSSEADEGLAPADIILAVDTSGSMNDEAEWTQQNMNAMVQSIVSSGVDIRVVLIASEEICVPAPLGSGSCPDDENLPNFRHVKVPVGSSDALEKIVSTYDQYKDTLRPSALKTVVVVSDDDSNMSASDFTAQLQAKDASFANFKFDAIVSFEDPFACQTACFQNACQNCGPCCTGCKPVSASEGKVYKQLVTMTGGVSGDLCAQDFAPVFKDMATAVVKDAAIDCIYDIPVPGADEQIDFSKVNVDYKGSPNSTPTPIFFVPGGAADCGPSGGWHYDDPTMPTKIILCESTCNAAQGNADGKIVVRFGCDTVVADPK